MSKKFRRVVAAASITAVVCAFAAAPANAATPTGVGSAGGNLTLASLDLGEVLQAALLGESNSATIDPAVSVAKATERLAPLDATALALGDLSLPAVETTSTGAQDQKSLGSPIDLSSGGSPISGTIDPATLSSIVDTAGARSTLGATLAELDALGIASIDSSDVNSSGIAGPSNSVATRGVQADAISVLNLQALLNFVGLDVTDFDIESLANFLESVDQLDLLNTVLGSTNFASGQDVLDSVDELETAVSDANALVDTAQAQLALLDCSVVSVLCGLLNDQIDGAQADALAAQGSLDALVGALFDVTANAPLVALDGVSAGAAATAADTIANSSATVTGTINDIRVGGLDLGGVDANTTLDQVHALGDQITTTLNDALVALDPALADLLTISLLTRNTSVFEQSGYQNAVAGITAVTVTVDVPDICDVLDGLPVQGGLPGGVEFQLPATPVSDLLDTLESTVNISDCFQVAEKFSVRPQIAVVDETLAALTGPATFKVASVNSVASFKVNATPTTPTTPEQPLPRTGMNEMLLLVFGGLMAAAALGLRRVTATARATTRQQ